MSSGATTCQQATIPVSPATTTTTTTTTTRHSPHLAFSLPSSPLRSCQSVERGERERQMEREREAGRPGLFSKEKRRSFDSYTVLAGSLAGRGGSTGPGRGAAMSSSPSPSPPNAGGFPSSHLPRSSASGSLSVLAAGPSSPTWSKQTLYPIPTAAASTSAILTSSTYSMMDPGRNSPTTPVTSCFPYSQRGGGDQRSVPPRPSSAFATGSFPGPASSGFVGPRGLGSRPSSRVRDEGRGGGRAHSGFEVLSRPARPEQHQQQSSGAWAGGEEKLSSKSSLKRTGTVVKRQAGRGAVDMGGDGGDGEGGTGDGVSRRRSENGKERMRGEEDGETRITDILKTGKNDQGQRVVNQYIRLSVLGRGCHGTVWLCEDMEAVMSGRQDTHYAVKSVYRQDRSRSLKRSQLAHNKEQVRRQQQQTQIQENGVADCIGGGGGGGGGGGEEEVGGFDFGGSRPGSQLEGDMKPALPMDEKVRQEIAIMKRCRNDHVVKLKEVIDDARSKKVFMVLEYMAGGPVQWQESPDNPVPIMTVDESKKIFRDVVLGLEYLHRQGIIHRDIKPANLLWDEKHTMVKISDFGVSHLSEALMRASSTGSGERAPPPPPTTSHSGRTPSEVDDRALRKTAGSPAFFAPELCFPAEALESTPIATPNTAGGDKEGGYFTRADAETAIAKAQGKQIPSRFITVSKPVRSPIMSPRPSQAPVPRNLDKRPPVGKEIDVWALGVTLYCLLFGKLPFQAKTEYELYNIIPRQEVPIPEFMGKDWKRTGSKAEGSGWDGSMTEEERKEGEETVDLLSKLLEKDPTKRITLAAVKKHPWVTRNLNNEGLQELLEPDEEVIKVTPDELSHATASRSRSKLLKPIGGLAASVRRAAERFGLHFGNKGLPPRSRSKSVSSTSAYTSAADGLSEPSRSRTASRQPSTVGLAGKEAGRTPSPPGSGHQASPNSTNGRKWSLRGRIARMGQGEPHLHGHDLNRTMSASSGTSHVDVPHHMNRQPSGQHLQLPYIQTQGRRGSYTSESPVLSPRPTSSAGPESARASLSSTRPISPSLAVEGDGRFHKGISGMWERLKGGSRTPGRKPRSRQGGPGQASEEESSYSETPQGEDDASEMEGSAVFSPSVKLTQAGLALRDATYADMELSSQGDLLSNPSEWRQSDDVDIDSFSDDDDDEDDDDDGDDGPYSAGGGTSPEGFRSHAYNDGRGWRTTDDDHDEARAECLDEHSFFGERGGMGYDSDDDEAPDLPSLSRFGTFRVAREDQVTPRADPTERGRTDLSQSSLLPGEDQIDLIPAAYAYRRNHAERRFSSSQKRPPRDGSIRNESRERKSSEDSHVEVEAKAAAAAEVEVEADREDEGSSDEEGCEIEIGSKARARRSTNASLLSGPASPTNELHPPYSSPSPPRQA